MTTRDVIHEKEETFLSYLIVTSGSRHKVENAISIFLVAQITEEDFTQRQDASHQHLIVIHIDYLALRNLPAVSDTT
jgi:hypothetical protein